MKSMQDNYNNQKDEQVGNTNTETLTLEAINKAINEAINTLVVDRLDKMDEKISRVESENRARYYDLKNNSFANEREVSVSSFVSTARSVGRSPRKLINSYDAYR